MLRVIFFSLLWLTACQADETISGYADRSAIYVLTSLNGDTFSANATLSFPEPGRISGRAPCNVFMGSQTKPYPWFGTGPLTSTKRACPELKQEQAFFSALGEMTLAEVQGDTLILSNEAGAEMVFTAQK
ncbi:META domain protein [Actibacterium lipolyticum]|uniref:META domain protein n=2 Tax=Actibacterium lipolyticum TaxID=1524263 RepID=A0A238JKX2_9RHOB|nr:META domain protein [Actibacterium lipolyticum]